MWYKIRKKILGIFFSFCGFFCGYPQFFGSDIPWSLSLTTSQYRKIYFWKLLALVVAAIYIWANVGEWPFALLSAPILRATLCGREKGRLINIILILAFHWSIIKLSIIFSGQSRWRPAKASSRVAPSHYLAVSLTCTDHILVWQFKNSSVQASFDLTLLTFFLAFPMPFLQLAQEGNSKISEKFQEWGKFEMIISYNVCDSDYQGCTAALLQPQTCENALKCFLKNFTF